jgi:hypothetical protein
MFILNRKKNLKLVEIRAFFMLKEKLSIFII